MKPISLFDDEYEASTDQLLDDEPNKNIAKLNDILSKSGIIHQSIKKYINTRRLKKLLEDNRMEFASFAERCRTDEQFRYSSVNAIVKEQNRQSKGEKEVLENLYNKLTPHKFTAIKPKPELVPVKDTGEVLTRKHCNSLRMNLYLDLHRSFDAIIFNQTTILIDDPIYACIKNISPLAGGAQSQGFREHIDIHIPWAVKHRKKLIVIIETEDNAKREAIRILRQRLETAGHRDIFIGSTEEVVKYIINKYCE